MQIIGITGGSGAGKSEVCRILGERGIPIFDADKEYARIAAPNSPCVREIAQAFGDGIIAPDGSLRRRELGAIVFAPGAEDKRRILNRITHRYVCSAAEAWLRECSARGERYAVIDAPMLFESGLNERCDTVVFVTADRQTRIDRIMRRDGIDEARARARIDAQHDDDFFRSRCDTVIENCKGAELAPAVDALLLSLDRRADTPQSAGNAGRVGSSLDASASDAKSNTDGIAASSGAKSGKAAGGAVRFNKKSGNAAGGTAKSVNTAGTVGSTERGAPGNNIGDSNIGNGNIGNGTASAAGSAANGKSDGQSVSERRGVLARYPLPRRTPVRIAIAAVLIFLALIAIINLAVRSPELIDNVTHPILYAELIDEYSGEYGVPPEIICAVIETESSFRADAVSGAGAMGLMQITRETFWWLLTKAGEDMEVERLFEPEINIKYGTYFLSLLYEEFGEWDTVYAAYNAGRSRVHGWLENDEITKDGRLVNIPIAETADYVEKVSRSVEKYRTAWAHQAEQLREQSAQ